MGENGTREGPGIGRAHPEQQAGKQPRRDECRRDADQQVEDERAKRAVQLTIVAAAAGFIPPPAPRGSIQ